MPNEPVLTWYRTVPNMPDEAVTSFDFGNMPSTNVQLETDTISFKITNATGGATVQGPILYFTGTDASLFSTGKWVYVKNTTDNGIASSDVFTAVSNSNILGYKALAGSIEPGTYIEFDVYLAIPPNTNVQQYNVSYVIEYQHAL